MLQEKNSLWIKVLRSKYGEYNGKVREGHFMKGSKGWSGGTWGGVTKVRGQSHWFASKIKWLVGEGEEVGYWDQVWVGGRTLREIFPRIYSNSEQINSYEGYGSLGG